MLDAGIENSIKLWGIILVKVLRHSSALCSQSNGNLTGKWTGSFLHHRRVANLWPWGQDHFEANLDNLASMYLDAAARSPVRIFPQFPWVSINNSFWPIWTMASPILASPWGWYCIVYPTNWPLYYNGHRQGPSWSEGYDAERVLVRHRWQELHVLNNIRSVVQKPVFVHPGNFDECIPFIDPLRYFFKL